MPRTLHGFLYLQGSWQLAHAVVDFYLPDCFSVFLSQGTLVGSAPVVVFVVGRSTHRASVGSLPLVGEVCAARCSGSLS